MLQAIHKESGKLVSAFQLIKDLTWSGKKSDEFIAPEHEIGNWEYLESQNIKEVKVTFIENHIRDGSPVRDYFRIVTDGAEYSGINESEEHKIAKKTIYQWAWDDLITIKNYSGKKLSEFGVSNIRLEKGSGSMRADVLIDFKERHETLGRGIAFEIQLSPQKKDRTQFRSYDRASQDYSVIWIWASDLKNEKKEFIVESVYDCIIKLKEQLTKETNIFLADISQKAEIKAFEIKKDIEEALYKLKTLSIAGIDGSNKEIKEILSRSQSYYDWAKLKLDKIENDINNRISELVKSETEKKIKASIEANTFALDLNALLEKYAQKYKDEFEYRLGELNILEVYKKALVLSFKCSQCGKYLPYENSLAVWKNQKVYCYKCNSEVKERDETKSNNKIF